MTVEYVVLGALIIVMSAVQIWLRHGPGGKALRAEQEAMSERRIANAAEEERDAAWKAAKRSGRLWNGWTAILGGVGIALGIALLVFGVLGR
jgi:hypothetical protein